MAGLFFPFALQALDKTIIASALPFIASDFRKYSSLSKAVCICLGKLLRRISTDTLTDELSQLNWIVSSFSLTFAAFIPAWGQFADIFGRHTALQATMVIMLVGSAICAGSPTSAFPLLLFGRALQGVGAAGIDILSKVVLADKVSLKENAKNNSIFAFVGGLSYCAGPAIGGLLTSVSWRWCFILNIPIALIGIVITFIVLRKELLGPQKILGVDDAGSPLENSTSFRTRLGARLATVDYGGQILFLSGMSLLILALTWGGSTYPWADVHVLAPLIIGAVTFIGFLVWEYLMGPGRVLALRYPRKQAMIPTRLLWSRNAGLLCYINFITGMAIFSIFYFIDLYFALVKEDSPSKAGFQLLYYTPGLGVGVCLAMFACNVWPRKTWWPLSLGTIIEPTGIVLLAVALGTDHLALIYGMLALSGVGTGIRFMPGTLHGVGYFPRDIAAIVSIMSLAGSVGGAFALTLMFTIFNNKMQDRGIDLRAGSSSSFGGIAGLDETAQKYLRDSARDSIRVAMFAMTSFLWLGVPVMGALGNVDISKGREAEVLQQEELDFSENVCKGAYIGSVLRRRKGAMREKEPVGPGHQQTETERQVDAV
ncbi:hypothetical protein ACEPPN_009122 [Leptodophora sp. 'Broadleaf-Isolate-01']